MKTTNWPLNTTCHTLDTKWAQCVMTVFFNSRWPLLNKIYAPRSILIYLNLMWQRKTNMRPAQPSINCLLSAIPQAFPLLPSTSITRRLCYFENWTKLDRYLLIAAVWDPPVFAQCPYYAPLRFMGYCKHLGNHIRDIKDSPLWY